MAPGVSSVPQLVQCTFGGAIDWPQFWQNLAPAELAAWQDGQATTCGAVAAVSAPDGAESAPDGNAGCG